MIKLTPYKAQTANYGFAHVTNPLFKGEKSGFEDKSDEITGTLEAISSINEARARAEKAKKSKVEQFFKNYPAEFKYKWEEMRAFADKEYINGLKSLDKTMEFFLKTREEVKKIGRKSENLYKEAKDVLEKEESGVKTYDGYEIKGICSASNPSELTLSLIDKETDEIYKVFKFLKNKDGVITPWKVFDDIEYLEDKITANGFFYKPNGNRSSYEEGLVSKKSSDHVTSFVHEKNVIPKRIISETGTFNDFAYITDNKKGDAEEFISFEQGSQGFKLICASKVYQGLPEEKYLIDFSKGVKDAQIKFIGKDNKKWQYPNPFPYSGLRSSDLLWS